MVQWRRTGAALLTAGGLTVSAWVHLDLASGYDAVGDRISLGTLFRVEAGLSLVAALAVLLRPRPWVLAAAAALALASCVAVVGSVYLDVPALGPLPPLHEPVWFPRKQLVATATAVAALAGAVGAGLAREGAPRGRGA